MSIINEALKKAEKEKQFTHNKQEQILSKINPVKIDRVSSVLKKRLLWAGTGVICLLGALLIINSFRSPFDFVALQETAPKTIAQTVPNSQSTFNLRKIDLEPLDVGPMKKTLDFHLSGILFDEQRPLALINGRIVREGSFIDEAKLLEIQPDYVRLSLQGKEFELKIK